MWCGSYGLANASGLQVDVRGTQELLASVTRLSASAFCLSARAFLSSANLAFFASISARRLSDMLTMSRQFNGGVYLDLLQPSRNVDDHSLFPFAGPLQGGSPTKREQPDICQPSTSHILYSTTQPTPIGPLPPWSFFHRYHKPSL